MNQSASGQPLGPFAVLRPALFAVAFLSLFINALVLVVPLYMLQLFDRVLSSRSYDTLGLLTIAAVGALLVYGALDAIRARLLIRVGLQIETRLADPIIRAELRCASLGIARPTNGLRDLHELRAFVTGPGVIMLCDSPWVPFYVLLIYAFHPLLGAIALGGAVVLFMIALLNNALTRRPIRESQLASERSLSHVGAASRNADVVEAMGMLSPLLGRWRREALSGLVPFAAAADRMALLISSAKAVRMVLQIVVLAAGVALVIEHQITPGLMIAASILLARALHPVEASIGTWKMLVSALAASKRIKSLLTEVPIEHQAISLPKPEGRLAVEGLAYVLPGTATPFIRGVDLELAPGESLGVVGPSGAGKTTLARLLTGIVRPQMGAVRLDDADVGGWTSDDRGRHIGYLPQEPQLFGGTVWENIARMQEDVKSEEVIRAAQRAYIHNMVLRMPKGYETEIGPDGALLSGGQRRLVALARCLFGDPRLLVLDEPGANLDPDGEVALQRALALASADGVTMVIISHQPRVLARVDKILVMENGMPKLLGPRDQVMSRIMAPRDSEKVTSIEQAKRGGKGSEPRLLKGSK